MNYNIKGYIIGITGKIAHAISQNLVHDKEFSPEHYLSECASVMYGAGLPYDVIDSIVKDALKQGKLEYAMGYTFGNSGAQISPSAMLEEDCAKLVGYLYLV